MRAASVPAPVYIESATGWGMTIFHEVLNRWLRYTADDL
jgi:hypothetical protein